MYFGYEFYDFAITFPEIKKCKSIYIYYQIKSI